MNSGQGFTLIELLVTMVVASVLISIAVPSYRNIVISNRLSVAANDYVAALSEARLTAIRRNSPTQFCGQTSNGIDTLGAGCGAAGGQISVLDSSGNATLLKASPATPQNLTLTSVKALRFGGQGLARAIGSAGAPYTGLVVDVGTDKISSRNRRCIYLTTGSSISTCAVTSTTTCPANEPSSCQ